VRRGVAQANPADAQNSPAFLLSVPVDEVSLTFHAADAHGLPINDLQLSELSLLDNGRPPRKVLDFRVQQDFPIRAGILMDTSESMEKTRATDRAIAIKYVQGLLRQKTDQAFVVNFGVLSKISQPWTNDPAALAEGIRNRVLVTNGGGHFAGTAVFDAIYRTCLGQFGHIDNAASGNFILLFSDGEDNASRAPLKLVVDTCQHSNTAVYVFRPRSTSSFPTGPESLMELTTQTGGRIFLDEDTEDEINNDLGLIEADLRNQYRLIYKPAELTRDGSFHSIDLKVAERVGSINIRSGYYAPTH
jgi:VWFA-related protein